MLRFARSAVRVYRGSFIGSFLIVLLGAALLSANGVFMETGLRADIPLLTSLAGSFAGTAILVVVLVVASTFGSALRQRHAQFALLRAVGATAGQVRAMITAEVAIVFALAAPLGAIPGLWAASLLTPVLISGGVVPAGFALTVSPLPVLGALLLLFPTALLAARLAARKVTQVSPTAAVSGSATETSHLSLVRRILAVALLVSGLVVAAIPFFVPGTMGSAAGATSAFLLISAAALAGPAIVGFTVRRASRATRSSRFASLMLAVVNTRGFSRRLTAAIIPLALFLALGTVQTGVNGSVTEAAGLQLREGIVADVVVTSPEGVTADQVAAIAPSPGVDELMTSSTVVAEVQSQDEDGLTIWEQTGLHAINGPGLIDVGVTAGSLDALADSGTIAVSSESLFMSGLGIGDTVPLRFDDGTELDATIVAIYDRGLGFGDYIIGGQSLPSVPVVAETVLVRGSLGSIAGLQTQTVDEYVDAAMAGAASSNQLGAILLFVLIVFVAIAAANTLVMLTGARKPELALLRRIGATRRQLSAMIGIESVFVTLAALTIGTASVVPALFGVAYGMLGSFSLAIDWATYGVLAAAVVVIAGVALMVPARIGGRVRV